MSKIFPIHPAHPERVCWGCDQYCAADDMRCGNGSDRTPHPVELFGEGWQDWGSPAEAPPGGADVSSDAVASPTAAAAHLERPAHGHEVEVAAVNAAQQFVQRDGLA